MDLVARVVVLGSYCGYSRVVIHTFRLSRNGVLWSCEHASYQGGAQTIDMRSTMLCVQLLAYDAQFISSSNLHQNPRQTLMRMNPLTTKSSAGVIASLVKVFGSGEFPVMTPSLKRKQTLPRK